MEPDLRLLFQKWSIRAQVAKTPLCLITQNKTCFGAVWHNSCGNSLFFCVIPHCRLLTYSSSFVQVSSDLDSYCSPKLFRDRQNS